MSLVVRKQVLWVFSADKHKQVFLFRMIDVFSITSVESLESVEAHATAKTLIRLQNVQADLSLHWLHML